jgi:hypothetical protein
MANYERNGKTLICKDVDGDNVSCKSFNEARRKSREFQKTGHTVVNRHVPKFAPAHSGRRNMRSN